MYRTAIRIALAAVLASGFAGCQSHKKKTADLQKQYDEVAAQFHTDCSAEMENIPPKLSPKCSAEDKKVTDAWNQLQAQRAKK